MEPVLAALTAFVLVVLVTASPLVALPAGLALGIYTIAFDAPLGQAALIGAAGGTAGRALLALQSRGSRGREPSPQARQQREALRKRLAASGSYRSATFSVALVPVLPARFVFPLLGAMQVPLRFALAGAFVGLVPMLALTTWLFVALARALTAGDAQAAGLLGMLAVLLVVRGVLRAIDWHHWRSARGLRFRDDAFEPRALFLPGAGAGIDDLIEGEVVVDGAIEGEVVVDGDYEDDGDSPPDEPGSSSSPPLPPPGSPGS